MLVKVGSELTSVPRAELGKSLETVTPSLSRLEESTSGASFCILGFLVTT